MLEKRVRGILWEGYVLLSINPADFESGVPLADAGVVVRRMRSGDALPCIMCALSESSEGPYCSWTNGLQRPDD